MSDVNAPARALLQAVRVLHKRGAGGLMVYPYYAPSGHWRCELYVGDDTVGHYSSADGWRIAGIDEPNADPESIALALWGSLSDDQRDNALVPAVEHAHWPNREYAFWFSALLAACGADGVPWLFSDDAHCLNDGFVGIAGPGGRSDKFPLPPGTALPSPPTHPDRAAPVYDASHREPVLTDAELADPELRGSYVLLEAVRVLHRRGAGSLLAFPYFGRVGFWRCEFAIAGEMPDARYTTGSPWLFPGHPEDTVRDPESVADGIWSLLTEEERAKAVVSNPAYTFWFSAVVDRCGPNRVPVLYQEEGSFMGRGFLRIQHGGHREDFPLPPGPILG
jgi:hypothetical protein